MLEGLILMWEEEMKTVTLSLAALLAALLIFAVQVAPTEAGYKGKCEHWLKAADAAQNRGDHKGFDLAMKHYSGCQGDRDPWLGRAIITGIGFGLSSYGHGGHGHNGHSHNH
jgi:hypothetical protein